MQRDDLSWPASCRVVATWLLHILGGSGSLDPQRLARGSSAASPARQTGWCDHLRVASGVSVAVLRCCIGPLDDLFVPNAVSTRRSLLGRCGALRCDLGLHVRQSGLLVAVVVGWQVPFLFFHDRLTTSRFLMIRHGPLPTGRRLLGCVEDRLWTGRLLSGCAVICSYQIN